MANKMNSRKSKAVGKKPVNKVAKKIVKKTAMKATKKISMKAASKTAKNTAKKTAVNKKMLSKKTPMKSPTKKMAGIKTVKTAPKKMAKPTVKSMPKPMVSTQTSSLVGQTIAPFSVFNSKGEPLTHETLKGRKAVLYFYPKDDTPGCTLEGQQFSLLASEFNEADTVVFGVSKDSVESHDKFICKYDFKIDLISDEKEQLCQIFDVIKEKNMYGKKYMGIERSTFVLDENLKVVKEVRKVSPDGHAKEILEFVKSL